MRNQTRRNFMKTTLAGAAGLSTVSASTWAKPIGANDDIRMGIVGIRSQGVDHINRFHAMKGVRVVALCDADTTFLDRESKKFTDRKEKVAVYQDARKMFESDEIDAIAVATPNHWHSLMTIWACQAGKDVKVEKPVSHNVWEGRQMVRAARKYGRIVQAGTESRSDPALHEAFKYIRDGNIGKILVARGFCYKPRGSIGKVSAPTKTPATLDYDLWTGPAPLKPLMRKNLHYDWHWVWDTGNGDIGNQGVHEMDMCRWALGDPELPRRVASIGGRFGYDDDGETANTHVAIYDYKPAPLIFEVRGLPMRAGMKAMPQYKGIRVGVVIECEGGYYAGGAGGGKIYDNNGKEIKSFKSSGGGAHSGNFIDCVRSRKNTDLYCDIPVGHVSTALGHLGNIAHRVGKEADPDIIRETIRGCGASMDAYERFSEHLKANNIDLAKDRATLGPWLDFDAAKETFTGPSPLAADANALLTRKYRAPYIVPDLG